jgi:hypothetical protein
MLMLPHSSMDSIGSENTNLAETIEAAGFFPRASFIATTRNLGERDQMLQEVCQ